MFVLTTETEINPTVVFARETETDGTARRVCSPTDFLRVCRAYVRPGRERTGVEYTHVTVVAAIYQHGVVPMTLYRHNNDNHKYVPV